MPRGRRQPSTSPCSLLGTEVVSGAYFVTWPGDADEPQDVGIIRNEPSGQGWMFQVKNTAGLGGQSFTFFPQAVCLDVTH